MAQQRWPEGFSCARCGHAHGSAISTRHSDECTRCHYQASLTAGTLFHSTNLPLTKWFWAIYLTASDQGGISAVRFPEPNAPALTVLGLLGIGVASRRRRQS